MELESSKSSLASLNYQEVEEDYDLVLERFMQVVDNWIEKGREIPLKDVPWDLLITIYHFFPTPSEWRPLACALGVDDLQTFNKIEGDALAKGRWGSEVLFEYCIKNTQLTFGDLIKVLSGPVKNIHLLQKLQEENSIDSFFEKYKKSKRKKQEQPFSLNEEESLKQLVSSYKTRKDFALEEFSPVQKKLLLREIECYNLSTSPIAQNSKELDDLLKKIRSKEFTQKHVPRSVPASKKRPVVLLSYSKDADELVPELVKRLWNIGVGVVSEYALKDKGYFETDFVTSWEKFFQQSHFIIPILSYGYLNDIRLPCNELQSRGVRFVYDMYTRRYVNDGCLNHYVRPLIMDNLNENALAGLNPTLEIKWKIWDDVDKFLKMINDYYLVRWQNYGTNT